MVELGIIVVYVVPVGYERMLALHLRQIERHTRVPYTIFGCLVRSSPRASDLLRSNRRVRLMPCAPTTSRGTAEHAHYLDQLAGFAVDAGAVHVATLHVDSFPIRDDWVEHLRSKLSNRCVLVTGTRGYSSCMMFTSAFHARHRPTFLCPVEERGRPEFPRCMKDWDLKPYSSGVGYAFQAYLTGHEAHFIPRATRPDRHATIYDERVFHLGGGCRLLPARSEPQIYRSARAALFSAVGALARAILPSGVRQALRARFARASRRYEDAGGEAARSRFRKETEQLLAAPDSYLATLRTRHR